MNARCLSWRRRRSTKTRGGRPVRLGQCTRNNVYVHLDLDVLDPADFGDVAVPTPGGVRRDALAEFVDAFCSSKEVLGASVVEFVGGGEAARAWGCQPISSSRRCTAPVESAAFAPWCTSAKTRPLPHVG